MDILAVFVFSAITIAICFSLYVYRQEHKQHSVLIGSFIGLVVLGGILAMQETNFLHVSDNHRTVYGAFIAAPQLVLIALYHKIPSFKQWMDRILQTTIESQPR